MGLGSSLGRDDAIGLALVQALMAEAAFEGRCVLLESADAASVASFLLDGRRPVVLVDAADMGLPAGEFRFFPDTDVSLILKTSSVSTHGLGLAEGLALARTLGYDAEVRVFGVQPFDVSPGRSLSPGMAGKFPALLDALRKRCLNFFGPATNFTNF